MKRGPYALRILLLLGANLQANRFALAAPPFGKWIYVPPLQWATFPSVDGKPPYALLLAIAALFTFVGARLTLLRLKDAGWPGWLAWIYLVPWVSLPLILLLMLFPTAGEESPETRLLDRFVPRDKTDCEMMSVLLTSAVGIPLVMISFSYDIKYGWALFAVLPFCMGVVSALFYSHHQARTLRESFRVATISVLLLGAILLAIAVEGLICLVMAAPIAIAFALLGAAVVYGMRRRAGGPSRTAAVSLFLFFIVPITMGAESAAHLAPPEWVVHTAIEIDAPPGKVWSNVIAFPPAPAPHELPFRAGIAYPIEAKLHGEGGVGSLRTCEFSTGTFVEVIDVWKPRERMEFSIAAGADPMTEMTPYRSIHPPHLDGYLHPRHAVFTLTPLPGGRTRLEGTSYYRNEIWPAQYWRLWSDYIIHNVHRRVFEHIKQLAEGKS